MSSATEAFLVFSSIYILLSWAFYLPYKTGQVYLGVIYAMMGSAYFTGVLTRDLGWRPELVIVLAALFGALLTFIPALGLRRASGMAVAVGSLSLIFILQTIILNTEALGAKAGFFGIPPYDDMLLASFVGIALGLYIVWRVEFSIIRRLTAATFHSHALAESNGINAGYVGIFLQTLSGLLAGYAGALFALQISTLFATQFGFSMLLTVVVAVFAGGATTFMGPLILAPIVFGLPLFLPEYLATYKDLIYGLALAAILLLRPEGLITRETFGRFLC